MTQIARILPVGLDQQERTILGVVVNLLAAFDLEINVLGDDDDQAPHIALIGGERPEGTAYLANSGGAPLKIVVSQTPVSGHGVHAVSKPLRVQTLKDVIFDLWTSHQDLLQESDRRFKPKLTRSRPETKAAPLAEFDAAQADNLFLALFFARSRRMHLLFSDEANHGILLDGLRGLCYSGLQSAELEKVCERRGFSQALEPGPFMSAMAGLKSKAFGDIAWSAAHFGARGRLYDGTELDAPLVMTAFPRFPRRHSRPEYMRVAAILTKMPMSLRELEANTGTSLEILMDFYNLGVILDVLHAKPPEGRDVRKLTGGKRGGLLAKIAKRLKFGGKN